MQQISCHIGKKTKIENTFLALRIELKLKFIKTEVSFIRSFDGTIQYQFDENDVKNIQINNNKIPEKMKFFIGGQTAILKTSELTPEGAIKNLRIEELFEPK